MRDVSHYTYRIVWSASDNEDVGQVVEFPSLSWLAATPTAAFEGIHAVVSEVVADMEANGEVVPNSFSERQYNG